jgi:hypothetical protein
MVKKKVDKKVKKNPWFKKRAGNLKEGWGFIPINWKGFVALALFFGINLFAVNYFDLNALVFDNWSKFGVVFLLSLFVLIEFAKKKTERR